MGRLGQARRRENALPRTLRLPATPNDPFSFIARSPLLAPTRYATVGTKARGNVIFYKMSTAIYWPQRHNVAVHPPPLLRRQDVPVFQQDSHVPSHPTVPRRRRLRAFHTRQPSCPSGPLVCVSLRHRRAFRCLSRTSRPIQW